jgi:hypothetical protein
MSHGGAKALGEVKDLRLIAKLILARGAGGQVKLESGLIRPVELAAQVLGHSRSLRAV